MACGFEIRKIGLASSTIMNDLEIVSELATRILATTKMFQTYISSSEPEHLQTGHLNSRVQRRAAVPPTGAFN